MGSSPPSKSRLKLRRAGLRGASASRSRYPFQMKSVALPMPGESSRLPPKSSAERFVVQIPFRNLLACGSPEPIVVLFDECFDVRVQVPQVLVVVGMNFFPLERPQEALATCIVVWVPRPAHAWNHPIFLQDLQIISGTVLHATIRMMYQIWLWLSLVNRLLQRRDRQSARERLVECPSDHLA